MAESEDVTFRDFAGALMGNDEAGAARVLSVLLGIDAAQAQTSTEQFRAKMASDPAFMQEAMGMRQVVQSGDEPGLIALLERCFGLDEAVATTAAGKVLARYR